MGEVMKKAWIVTNAGAAFALAVMTVAGFAFAFGADNEEGSTATPASASFKATNGIVKCTAAINADGSVAACKHCNPADTKHLSTGTYSVGFSAPCLNVRAPNGFSRWVQADALGTGSTDAYCTTADRRQDPNAIFVQCQNAGGTVDTPFFLFVAR
jgi:hypothetical protein